MRLVAPKGSPLTAPEIVKLRAEISRLRSIGAPRYEIESARRKYNRAVSKL